MHYCTMCGLMKPELGRNPEFEFRSRRRHGVESYIEGVSDWCPKCEALRFFFKSENTGDYFIERPKQKLANYMLEATAVGCHDDRSSGSRSNKESDEIKSLRYWKARDDLRQEARKVIREELLSSVPSALLRKNSTWDANGRSRSEVNRHRIHSGYERRSKSVVNEVRAEKVKPALGSQIQVVYKADKRDLGEGSRESIQFGARAPINKMQEYDLLNPWHDAMQPRTNEAMGKRANRKRKTGHMCAHGERARATNAAPEKKSCAIQTLTGEKVARDMKKAEQEQLNDGLFIKLQEKKLLVSEWEMIRRRVEDECDRVKAELAALKQKRDMGIELGAHMDISQGNMERRQGGKKFTKLVANELSVEEVKKDDVSKSSRIGDATMDSVSNIMAVLNAEFDKLLENSTTNYKLLAEAITNRSEIKEAKIKQSHQRLHKPSVKTSAAAYAVKPKRMLSKLNMLVSTVQRARFRGFPDDPLKTARGKSTSKGCDPPLAQFSTLPCASQELINLLAIKREVLQPDVERPLKMCRSPIFCPDADCQRMFFVSDFNDHLAHEHPSLAMERISPCKAKTFFLDTRVILLNKAKCSMVYFVKDKFIDSSSDKYPDLLPILVMTARINAPHFFAMSPGPIPGTSSTKRSPDQEIYMIWLTSIRPDDVKIVGTISVWPTSSQPIVEYLMVQTSEVYNIRCGQRLKAIYNSNRSMALPGNVVNRMTDNGGHLLAVQVLIH